MANFLIDCVHTMFYSQVQVSVATASWAVEWNYKVNKYNGLCSESIIIYSVMQNVWFLVCLCEHGHTVKWQISMWICVVRCTLWQKMHIYYFKTICLENECPRTWRNSSTTSNAVMVTERFGNAIAMHYSIRMAVTTHSRYSLCMNLKYERTTDGIRNSQEIDYEIRV